MLAGWRRGGAHRHRDAAARGARVLQALSCEDEEKLRRTCLLSLGGEHLAAQQAYIELVIGSAKWPIGGFGYISSDAPKGNERCWGQKYRRIEEKASLLDNDAVRVALQSFKRLLSFMETRPPK